jgi:hypothetical protein
MIRRSIRNDSVSAMDHYHFKYCKSADEFETVCYLSAKSLGGSSFAATDSRFGSGTDRPLNRNV